MEPQFRDGVGGRVRPGKEFGPLERLIVGVERDVDVVVRDALAQRGFRKDGGVERRAVCDKQDDEQDGAGEMARLRTTCVDHGGGHGYVLRYEAPFASMMAAVM